MSCRFIDWLKRYCYWDSIAYGLECQKIYTLVKISHIDNAACCLDRDAFSFGGTLQRHRICRIRATLFRLRRINAVPYYINYTRQSAGKRNVGAEL